MQRIAAVLLLTLTIACSMPLTGCSTSGTDALNVKAMSTPSSTRDSIRSRIRQKRQMQGAALGCVGVGVASGFIALLAGATAERAALYAAGGCAAGAAAGLAYGSYVDARAQSYADAQSQLISLVEGVRKDVTATKELNLELRRLVDEEKKRAAELGAASSGTTEVITELRQHAAQLEAELGVIDGDITELSKRGDNVSGLKTARSELAKETRALMGQIEKLAAVGGGEA